jgi:hypothetical protein
VSRKQVEDGIALAQTHRTEERFYPQNVSLHAGEFEKLSAKGKLAYRGEYARRANVLDRTPKPSPRRHTGPVKDLLVGMAIGAGLMLGCFALGALQVFLGY